VAIRILTDEHVAVEVSHRLQHLGYDVVCVRDRGLLHREDWELMRWCIDRGYAICTRNRRHFEREHQEARSRGEDHYGILLIGREWTPEDIYWALREYLESDPDPALLMNQGVTLAKATPDFIRDRSDDQG
jgi:hypothetical protein